MIKSIKIEVPTTTTLHIKQAQIIPAIKTVSLRKDFDSVWMKNQTSRWGSAKSRNFEDIQKWQGLADDTDRPRHVIELHLPCKNWRDLKKVDDADSSKTGLLANPEFLATLYFIGGKKFNEIAGHPDGTELFVIDDVIYRRLTWRSITTKFWDRKSRDAGITWKTDDEFVYFLLKCEKINKEPIKSIIIDGIGLELLERDRPKVTITESCSI